MRVITWNVNHRAAQRKIPPTMAGAIVSLEPDVAVLTEWVPGDSRTGFLDQLTTLGLKYQLASKHVKRENSVLIASRSPLKPGNIYAPAIAPSVPSNLLHAHLPEERIDILGLRIPDYSRQPRVRRQCWDWIIEATGSLVSKPSIIIGDFNTDPSYPPSKCGDRIQQLIDSNWQHAISRGSHSYWTPKGHGVCIDHAFVSDHFKVRDAKFITQNADHVFVGKGIDALSDHAVLVIDVEPFNITPQ